MCVTVFLFLLNLIYLLNSLKNIELILTAVVEKGILCSYSLFQLNTIFLSSFRFKNYMVALMNKNLIPSKMCPPFIGESVCFSRGLRYNIEMILFRGPWAAFENNWHLKEEFKRSNKRNELAQKLSRQIFWVAFGNLLLSPLVFLWSLMVFFFSYADVMILICQ